MTIKQIQDSVTYLFVYKIPYRRARTWPSARAKASCIQLICVHDTLSSCAPLGLTAALFSL